MPGATSFRQTEEKQSSFIIDLMLWSPKMDLIAVTAVTGEVLACYRLWHRSILRWFGYVAWLGMLNGSRKTGNRFSIRWPVCKVRNRLSKSFINVLCIYVLIILIHDFYCLRVSADTDAPAAIMINSNLTRWLKHMVRVDRMWLQMRPAFLFTFRLPYRLQVWHE